MPTGKSHGALGGHRNFLPAMLAVVACILVAGCGTTRARQFLEVADCDSEKILLRLELQPQAVFSVWFLHSYDRAFFEEYYRVLGEGRILLTHMIFKSSLNGQGFAMGTYRANPDGTAELADIDQEMAQVIFRLGSSDLANHTLKIQERSLRLLDYANAGDLLCIRVHTQ